MVFLGKSLPTTAINPGFVKKLAEMAANVAAPPSTFFRVFLGVLIVSSAVDPKTVNMYFLAEIMYKSLVKKISC